MVLGRIFRPTNRRVRLLVGLFLAGLFCIQCTTPTSATRESSLATALEGEIVGRNAPAVLAKVDRLARKDHIALLEFCLANYSGRIRDYTCTFEKQEMLHGRLGKLQTIQVKFKESPFSVVLAWVKNAPQGDRVLYVEGLRDNQMIVRPTNGFLRSLTGGSVLREPDGAEAMQSTLRPVNMFGFKRGLENLLEVYRAARDHGELREEFGGYYDVEGRKTVKLVRYLPATRDYPAWRTDVYIDLEYLLPVRIEGYNWDKKLSSSYTYRDVKFNIGLTDDDFLPEQNDL